MSIQESKRKEERRAAIRWLLASPVCLGSRDPENFAVIVRHARWLIQWFDEAVGWRLAVDPTGGFARLFKVPAAGAGRRAIESRSGVPFDRRRYTLLSLALATLSGMAGQMTVRRLAELVQDMTRGEAGVDPFDPERVSERRAFVDALLWLADTGVLRNRTGDAESYARDGQGDALYDVNDRLLVHLVGTAVAPSVAGSPADLSREPYAETDDGQRLRARHEVTRALLDEPVLYYEDLSEAARAWLDHGRHYLYERVQDDAGFEIERREEGLAAVDPAGEVTDERFPDGSSTIKHAALLLAEQLAAGERRNADFPSADIEALVSLMIRDYGQRCAWSLEYTADPAGAARLATDAMVLLERFGLVRRIDDLWRARPAIARFRPGAPGAQLNDEVDS